MTWPEAGSFAMLWLLLGAVIKLGFLLYTIGRFPDIKKTGREQVLHCLLVLLLWPLYLLIPPVLFLSGFTLEDAVDYYLRGGWNRKQ